MKTGRTLLAAATMLMAGTALAFAEGELHIYNWGNYTSPEMIKKFEQKYNVKVTVTDYDSNDTVLAKIRQGGDDETAKARSQTTKARRHGATPRRHQNTKLPRRRDGTKVTS